LLFGSACGVGVIVQQWLEDLDRRREIAHEPAALEEAL
jgi:hypothetical protein